MAQHSKPTGRKPKAQEHGEVAPRAEAIKSEKGFPMNWIGTITGDVARRAGLLGVVAGMRSQLPLALLAVSANRGDFAASAGWPFDLLRSRPIAFGFGATSVGELIGDKLPAAPDRTAPAPLIGRLAFGAAAGAAVAADAKLSIPLGVGTGALGALVGSYAAYHARAYLDRTTGWPDAVWATVEDAVAIAVGLAAMRTRVADKS